MKVRLHRGGLAESMETTCEVSSLTELYAFFDLPGLGGVRDIQALPYGYDERIQWNTYLLTGILRDNSRAPLGQSDGPIPESWYAVDKP